LEAKPVTEATTPNTNTQVKICGLNTLLALDTAISARADYVGLVHFPKSPRHISLEAAAAMRKHAAGKVKTVLLLVNAELDLIDQALRIVQPDIIQFHGSETPEMLKLLREQSDVGIWKALGVSDTASLANSGQYIGAVDLLLFDAPAQALPGGTGASFDWSLLAQHEHSIPWGLAGGLTPDNVADAIRVTGAPLVDVSSGVESEAGVKDVAKIAAFCQAVRDLKKGI
jgi:phosphoribosylanthranilate isomerase